MLWKTLQSEVCPVRDVIKEIRWASNACRAAVKERVCPPRIVLWMQFTGSHDSLNVVLWMKCCTALLTWYAHMFWLHKICWALRCVGCGVGVQVCGSFSVCSGGMISLSCCPASCSSSQCVFNSECYLTCLWAERLISSHLSWDLFILIRWIIYSAAGERERVKAVLIIDVISVDTLNWCDDGLQLQFVQVMNHDSAVIMNLLLLMTTTSDWDNNHTQNHSRWFTLNKQLQMIRLNISPLHSVQRFTSQMNVSTLLLWTIRFI